MMFGLLFAVLWLGGWAVVIFVEDVGSVVTRNKERKKERKEY